MKKRLGSIFPPQAWVLYANKSRAFIASARQPEELHAHTTWAKRKSGTNPFFFYNYMQLVSVQFCRGKNPSASFHSPELKWTLDNFDGLATCRPSVCAKHTCRHKHHKPHTDHGKYGYRKHPRSWRELPRKNPLPVIQRRQRWQHTRRTIASSVRLQISKEEDRSCTVSLSLNYCSVREWCHQRAGQHNKENQWATRQGSRVKQLAVTYHYHAHFFPSWFLLQGTEPQKEKGSWEKLKKDDRVEGNG